VTARRRPLEWQALGATQLARERGRVRPSRLPEAMRRAAVSATRAPRMPIGLGDPVQAKRERADAQERSCCLATYFAPLRAHRVTWFARLELQRGSQSENGGILERLAWKSSDGAVAPPPGWMMY
jgi:hypothetical protein